MNNGYRDWIGLLVKSNIEDCKDTMVQATSSRACFDASFTEEVEDFLRKFRRAARWERDLVIFRREAVKTEGF